MTDGFRIRFDAGSAETVDRLGTGPLPDGVHGSEPEREAFRDVYFDTETGALQERGVEVRVRLHPGRATLAVRTPECAVSAEVAVEDDPRAALDAPSEPVRVLRALVDPDRLVRRMEVETVRRIRRIHSDGDGWAGELVCDAVTVRQGELAAELFEAELRFRERSGAAERAGRLLALEFGLHPAEAERVERAREALREAELRRLEDGVRAARHVAVLVYDDGRIALQSEAEVLSIPSAEGHGEEACRGVLRSCFGTDAGRIRLLGTAPGSRHRAAVEVWLAEGVHERPESREVECEVVHLAADEVLAAVGSPSLRDRDTLAALHVLSRSGLPLRPGRGGAQTREEGQARAAMRAPPEAAREAEGPDLPPGTLLNMELSILAFNRRVLGLAEDPGVPLLERVRFLAIFGSNLDEFFRVRVSRFKRYFALGREERTIDGVVPEEQLDAIGARVCRLMERAYALLFGALLPELAEHGIELCAPDELDEGERAFIEEYYRREVHSVLTPLTAGPGHPFPHVRNLRPALVALLCPADGEERLGIVELPDGLPRFVRLPGGRRVVPLEEVIREHVTELYPGVEVVAAHAFRVTRSAELHLKPEQIEDLLRAVEEQVRKRRFRPVVRLEVEAAMPPGMRALLLRELQYEVPARPSVLSEHDVYVVERIVDLSGLRELAEEEDPELHYPPAEGGEPALDPARPVVEVLREREVLVHFPEDSFEESVERLILEAAEDPDVVAVKLALYRTNPRSRIVEAMRRASARGKQVAALVELTARFDERQNIRWARYLRAYGIDVVYGVPGLKVHAKIALIIRREAGGIRRYAYIGTGNLNASTAELYTDLGLLSADPAIGDELADVFNALTGGAGRSDYDHLLVAPYNMRERFLAMVEREIEHARAGRGGLLRIKVNGLADREMIAALYRASRAGVRCELIVRSICSLRPGVAGLSENIRVVSILGRYLEHARIYHFANAGEPEYYIGSADWRTRNLSRRVEVVVPIRDPDHRARLDAILTEQIDSPGAWELGADGTYYRRPEPAPREVPLPHLDTDRRPIITSDTWSRELSS